MQPQTPTNYKTSSAVARILAKGALARALLVSKATFRAHHSKDQVGRVIREMISRGAAIERGVGSSTTLEGTPDLYRDLVYAAVERGAQNVKTLRQQLGLGSRHSDTWAAHASPALTKLLVQGWLRSSAGNTSRAELTLGDGTPPDQQPAEAPGGLRCPGCGALLEIALADNARHLTPLQPTPADRDPDLLQYCWTWIHDAGVLGDAIDLDASIKDLAMQTTPREVLTDLGMMDQYNEALRIGAKGEHADDDE